MISFIGVTAPDVLGEAAVGLPDGVAGIVRGDYWRGLAEDIGDRGELLLRTVAPRQLTPHDGDHVGRDQGPEARAMRRRLRHNFVAEVLLHCLQQLIGRRSIVHRSSSSIMRSVSSSISAQMRPRLASSMLRCRPPRCRAAWPSVPMAQRTLPKSSHQRTWPASTRVPDARSYALKKVSRSVSPPAGRSSAPKR